MTVSAWQAQINKVEEEREEAEGELTIGTVIITAYHKHVYRTHIMEDTCMVNFTT